MFIRIMTCYDELKIQERMEHSDLSEALTS